MTLIKRQPTTEKQLAANRRNQRLCNGPVTEERRERIRPTCWFSTPPFRATWAARKAALHDV
jgi:hypothetical protein